MIIKCSDKEEKFLIKYLGKEVAETYPWDIEGDDIEKSISVQLCYLQLREGFSSDQQTLNVFGRKCQEIYDSLLEQNG